jgi:hypothetical protein
MLARPKASVNTADSEKVSVGKMFPNIPTCQPNKPSTAVRISPVVGLTD